MSTTVAAVIVNLLVTVLPLVGITLGTEQIATTVQTLTAVLTGLWIWKERVDRGDVTIFGSYK